MENNKKDESKKTIKAVLIILCIVGVLVMAFSVKSFVDYRRDNQTQRLSAEEPQKITKVSQIDFTAFNDAIDVESLGLGTKLADQKTFASAIDMIDFATAHNFSQLDEKELERAFEKDIRTLNNQMSYSPSVRWGMVEAQGDKFFEDYNGVSNEMREYGIKIENNSKAQQGASTSKADWQTMKKVVDEAFKKVGN